MKQIQYGTRTLKNTVPLRNLLIVIVLVSTIVWISVACKISLPVDGHGPTILQVVPGQHVEQIIGFSSIHHGSTYFLILGLQFSIHWSLALVLSHSDILILGMKNGLDGQFMFCLFQALFSLKENEEKEKKTRKKNIFYCLI